MKSTAVPGIIRFKRNRTSRLLLMIVMTVHFIAAAATTAATTTAVMSIEMTSIAADIASIAAATVVAK